MCGCVPTPAPCCAHMPNPQLLAPPPAPAHVVIGVLPDGTFSMTQYVGGAVDAVWAGSMPLPMLEAQLRRGLTELQAMLVNPAPAP